MDYKNNSNTGLIIVADCMLLSVEYIGNVHLFFNTQICRSLTKKTYSIRNFGTEILLGILGSQSFNMKTNDHRLGHM